MSIEAMKLALEYLEESDNYLGSLDHSKPIAALRQAIEQAEKNQFNPDWDAMAVMVDEQQRMAKRIEELEQAEKQEPVAVYQYRNPHCSDWYDGIPDHHDGHGPYEVRTLYTTPQPQREWVGLTEDEYKNIRYGQDEGGDDYVDYELFDEGEYGFEVNIYVDRFAKAIEAKLKEKNT